MLSIIKTIQMLPSKKEKQIEKKDRGWDWLMKKPSLRVRSNWDVPLFVFWVTSILEKPLFLTNLEKLMFKQEKLVELPNRLVRLISQSSMFKIWLTRPMVESKSNWNFLAFWLLIHQVTSLLPTLDREAHHFAILQFSLSISCMD